MLRLDANLGEICFFCPSFLLGDTKEIGIAALPTGLKPRHVEKFRERRLTDVGESELTHEKRRNMRKTSDHVRKTGELKSRIIMYMTQPSALSICIALTDIFSCGLTRTTVI